MASRRTSSSHTISRRLGEMGVQRCKCGDEVIVLTSWIEQNYGTRFVKCPNYMERWTCKYFDWIDGPVENPMLDGINKLKEENVELRRRMRKLERLIYVVVAINILLCKMMM
ncbi:uncharacterized protein LOC114743294 [Neltuma alba]|uniref:uncharacterized protein LOC114743294 n=1 Tax=Neltuma alba TaxID=207710 RepID=UPI0010A39902|nr:uncharacterized protein LOC114743294 [Prosopis alba]